MSARVPGRHPRIVTPAAALAVGLLILGMLALTAVFSSMAHQTRLSNLGQAAIWLSFGLVGVIVAWHQPRNPMGWILLGITFFFMLDALAGVYSHLDYRLHGGRLPVGWLAVLLAPSWAPAIVLAGLSLLLFPDGLVPSSRWKPVLWAYLAVGALWLRARSSSRPVPSSATTSASPPPAASRR